MSLMNDFVLFIYTPIHGQGGSMAKLYYYYGAMSSGKTVDLIETAHKYEQNGKTAIVVKPEIDVRGNDRVVSRIGLSKKVDLLLKPEESFFDFLPVWKEQNVYCILVDEAQFLTPKQVEELYQITKQEEIAVICYGLRTDFRMQGFPGSSRLLELADAFQEFVAICTCGAKARHNARKKDGVYVSDGPQVLIGADETYEPMCGDCYYHKVVNKEQT